MRNRWLAFAGLAVVAAVAAVVIVVLTAGDKGVLTESEAEQVIRETKAFNQRGGAVTSVDCDLQEGM
ncbi:MAG: hypothetical protein WD649_02650 [Thermoleophilaceae bacterium]